MYYKPSSRALQIMKVIKEVILYKPATAVHLQRLENIVPGIKIKTDGTKLIFENANLTTQEAEDLQYLSNCNDDELQLLMEQEHIKELLEQL